MKTKAIIQFKQQNTDGEGTRFRLFSLVVENVFRVEDSGSYNTKLYYSIPGSVNTKCLIATISWQNSIAAIDAAGEIWKYVIRANNNPGSCETVDISNSDGGELWATGNLSITQDTLPTA